MRIYRAGALVVALAACGDDTAIGGSGGVGGGGGGGTGGVSDGGGGASGGLVCESPFVLKGPWSLRFDETSARIRWESCSEEGDADLVFSEEPSGTETTVTAIATPFTLRETHSSLGDVNPADFAGTYYIYEATLEGLTAGTCYQYHLAADPLRNGRVCAAKAAGEPFTFMAIGDTNPALGTTGDTVAQALPSNFDFTIHGGDLQYYSSLLETWASWFPIMQPMLSQGAFMPAIGNHESEVALELDEYALRFFGGAGFDGNETYYRFQSGGVWFFNVNTEEPTTQGSEQAIWLEQQLADAAAQQGHRFSVVYFHRPILTCGDSGDDEAAFTYLEPVFEANKVLFVVQAHMHGYERFDLGATAPTYITTAGGGAQLGNVDANLARAYCDQRAESGAFYHSTIFRVGATETTVEVIDNEGAIRDSFSRSDP